MQRSAMGGYIKIATAAIIWGSIGVVVRLVDLPVVILTFYRMAFAALAILVYMTTQRKVAVLSVGRYIYVLVLMGVLLTLNWTAFFYSIRLTSIANAVLLMYTAPILVALLAPVFLKERLERITLLSLAIAVVGAVLIASPSLIGFQEQSVAGLVAALIAALTYTALVLIAKVITEKVDILAIIFYEELTSTILLAPALFVYDVAIDLPTMLILFVLGAFHTAFAVSLYLSGLREVKAQQVGIFTYLEPVSAIVFAAAILGEVPSMTTLAGGALIIASGVLLVAVTRRRVEAEVVSE